MQTVGGRASEAHQRRRKKASLPGVEVEAGGSEARLEKLGRGHPPRWGLVGPVSLRVAGNQRKVFSRGLPTASHRTF